MRPPAAVPPCCSERLGSSLLFKERDWQAGRASDLLSGSLVLSSAIPSIGVEVGRPLRWFLAARRHLPRARRRGGPALPYADADMMQIPPTKSHAMSRTPTPFSFSTGPGGARRQARRAQRHHPDLPARRSSTRSGTSGGLCARTGSQTPRSKTTTRSSTPLRRLATPYRPARNDRLHRNARLGPCRSDAMTFGIISKKLACRLDLGSRAVTAGPGARSEEDVPGRPSDRRSRRSV